MEIYLKIDKNIIKDILLNVMLTAVLFDLEGTLVKSGYQKHPNVLNRLHKETKELLIKQGIPKKILHNMDKSVLLRNKAYEWVKTTLSNEELKKLNSIINSFMLEYDMYSAYHSSLYSDAISVLKELKNKNYKMGIVTNTSRIAANYMLNTFWLSSYFDTIVTRDDVIMLKPDPEMIFLASYTLNKKIGWLVGDSKIDVLAADNANIKSIVIKRDGKKPSYKFDFFTDSLEKVPLILDQNVL